MTLRDFIQTLAALPEDASLSLIKERCYNFYGREAVDYFLHKSLYQHLQEISVIDLIQIHSDLALLGSGSDPVKP